MSLPDHYRALGVPRFAPPGIVRRAYVDLMKRHHGLAEARMSDEMMRRVSRAYWELRHPDRRAAYDALLRGRPRRRPIAASAGAAELPARTRPRHPLPRPQRRPDATRLVFAVSLAGLIGVAIWASGRPARHPLSAMTDATAIRPTADPASPGRAAIQEALSDYEAIRSAGGDARVARYLRDCFAELTISAPTRVFDYCVALESVAALDPRRDGREAAFYGLRARRARLDRVALISAPDLHLRWEAINHAVSALRPTESRHIGDGVAANPTRDPDRAR